jgi:hypothetical protein
MPSTTQHPIRYHHMVPLSNSTLSVMNVCLESSVVFDPATKVYTHTQTDPETGSKHERYFDNLADFIIWHCGQYDSELEGDLLVRLADVPAAHKHIHVQFADMK